MEAKSGLVEASLQKTNKILKKEDLFLYFHVWRLNLDSKVQIFSI